MLSGAAAAAAGGGGGGGGDDDDDDDDDDDVQEEEEGAQEEEIIAAAAAAATTGNGGDRRGGANAGRAHVYSPAHNLLPCAPCVCCHCPSSPLAACSRPTISWSPRSHCHTCPSVPTLLRVHHHPMPALHATCVHSPATCTCRIVYTMTVLVWWRGESREAA